jgi:hypothetical protein
MSSLEFVECCRCGIVNNFEGHLCVLCGVRLDKPRDFTDKSMIMKYFSRGGMFDLAIGAMEGELPEDDSDIAYSAMVDTTLKLGLEESWATLDLVFYRENPVLQVPTMGVRWPSNPLFQGIELTFVENGRDTLYVALERPSAEKRGTNYRWDAEFADPKYEYQIALYGEVRMGRSRPRYIKSETVSLRPDPSGDRNAPYSLVRTLSGIRVK